MYSALRPEGLNTITLMVWFTKLTVLFFLECGWVGGVCWVVVVRGMRNFRVRTLASQFWFASWNVFVGNFISNISVKMSDSDCKFVHFS